MKNAAAWGALGVPLIVVACWLLQTTAPQSAGRNLGVLAMCAGLAAFVPLMIKWMK